MGLARTLKKRGYKVQSYKCGPDFMDAQLMGIATDRHSVNLDIWMSSNTHVQHLYNKYGEQADVCITEGVGALFDGYHRMQGSSAETTQLLKLPVILLVNARVAGYSVAPVIYGFRHFYAGVQIAGVIFNQVSSPAHYSVLREACTDAGVDCLGYISYHENFRLPSKHSALSSTNRKLLDEQLDSFVEIMEKTVDIKRLLSRCNRNFPCQYSLPYSSDTEWDLSSLPFRKMKIAVARDSAFNFIYCENLNRLAQIGEITYFSPLFGQELPKADLIYLPGGYPELFARQLYRRRKMMDALKDYAENGGKIWAEGNGSVILGRSLKVRENGTAYPMAHILPLDFTMPPVPRLVSGYRKMNWGGAEWRGYEFRYSDVQQNEIPESAVSAIITNPKGTENGMHLYRYKNVLASCVHWYWGDKDILKMWK